MLNLLFSFSFSLHGDVGMAQSVGKTSIITRFMYDKFDNTYQVMHSMPCLFYALHLLLLLGFGHPLSLRCAFVSSVWQCIYSQIIGTYFLLLTF